MMNGRLFLASLLLLFGPVLPAAAAGLAEARDAMALLYDNQNRARDLGKKHAEAAKADLTAKFLADNDVRILQVHGQLIVAQQLLEQAQVSTDPKVKVGVTIGRDLAEVNRQTKDLALQPVEAADAAARIQALEALDDQFDRRFLMLPEGLAFSLFETTRVEETVKRHQDQIIQAMAKTERDAVTQVSAAAAAEEYRRKVEARDRKQAAEVEYRERRLKEIEEGNKARDAEQKLQVGLKPKAPPPPPPPPPADLPMVQAWHKTYTFKMTAFKKALGKLLVTDRSRQSKVLAQACGELSSAVEALLRDRTLLSRKESIDVAIKGFLLEYKIAAGSCYGGELAAMGDGLKKGEAGIGQLAVVLQPYGLSP